jgi:hypothetical protein
MTTFSPETLQAREAAALQLGAEREGGFTREDAAQAMGCGEKQAGWHLLQLVRAGKLKKIRGGLAARYCLPDRVNATLAFLEEQAHAEKLAVRQVLVPADQTRVDVPRGAVASIFDLGTRLAA